MAKIATDVLKMGFVVAAVPGNVVTADDETIERWGWADKIKDSGDASPAPTAQTVVVPNPNDLPAGA